MAELPPAFTASPPIHSTPEIEPAVTRTATPISPSSSDKRRATSDSGELHPQPISAITETTSTSGFAQLVESFLSIKTWLAISLGLCLLCIVILAMLLFLLKKRQTATHRLENDSITSADYKLLGDLAAKERQLELAERCYRKTIALEPHNRSMGYELGIFLFRAERYQEAIPEFLAYLKGDIIEPEVYDYLGYAYFSTGNLSRAEEYYRKFLDLAPADPDGYFGLGLIAQHRERYQDAKDYYETALKLDPDFQEVCQNLSQIQTYL
ncbi:hypothetical protein CSA56_09145 [candidate division KSB3 bacterium]|uniref:Uncharacterized protein n=1 Tax=candidate division KSB3 bacterium TaxID=2044937 RepID=A0A2G6KF98_9BACT|nr:MAG: hypothetical protein CSA56_09145 [candidate division KSB3 bacterium]